MSAPKRIQLRRTKGWRKPDGAIVVARPSRWGNPYKAGDLIVDPVNSVNPIPSVIPKARAYTMPVGAFNRTDWRGNPYRCEVRYVADACDAVVLYRRWLDFEQPDLAPLRGHDLACWCPLTNPCCHADVLLDLANRSTP